LKNEKRESITEHKYHIKSMSYNQGNSQEVTYTQGYIQTPYSAPYPSTYQPTYHQAYQPAYQSNVILTPQYHTTTQTIPSTPPTNPSAPPSYTTVTNNDIEKGSQVELVYVFGENDHLFNENERRNFRHKFILKVYIILFIQLLFTFGVTILFTMYQPLKTYAQNNLAMLITAIVLTFALIIILACCGNIARSSPWNYLLLGLFTLAMSYMLGVVASFYDTFSVMFAILITIAVVVGLTLFACQTKYDFTGWGPYLFGFLIILILFGALNGFVCGFMSCKVLNILYSCIGALLFSFYIIYDTQLVVGGNHRKYQFSTDDYIFAALNLYLDVVNLFVYVLSCVGNNNNN